MNQKMENCIDVWLVEDNRSYARALARALGSGQDINCTSQFRSAEELFLALNDRQPDVVLLDVQLPGIDGLTALAQLRREHVAIKVLVLTAFDDDDKIFRAVCAGASGYLLKTSKTEEILNAVNEAWHGGAPMTPCVARRVLDLFATMSSSLPAKQHITDLLTDRERDVLRLMADGLVKKEIAQRLHLSVHTVNTHIRSIYEKLHVSTNTGAVAKALREDLI